MKMAVLRHLAPGPCVCLIVGFYRAWVKRWRVCGFETTQGIGVACILSGALLASSPAFAQPLLSDDDRARLHFEAGRSYYDQSRYEDSAREFLEAYRLSQRHELLLNAARSYERALLFDQAIETLERWLEVSPDQSSRAMVEERLANVRRLSGRLAGSAGEPAEAASGSDGSVYDPGRSPDSDLGEPDRFPIGPVVVLGGAGALSVGALVTGLMADANYSNLEEQCIGGACPPELSGDKHEGETLAVVSTAMTFGAAAAAAGGVLWLLLDSGEEEQTTTPAVSFGPTMGGGKVVLGGVW